MPRSRFNTHGKRRRILPGKAAGPAASLLCLLILLACSLPGIAHAEQDVDADQLQRLVHQDCGSCHGLRLKGGLGPDLQAKTLEHYDADILEGVILDGIPGTAMPPWRPLLTETEAAWIANYLLTGETQ